MDQEEHPVWQVYDQLKTARLNVKYWSAKLYRTESTSFWMDIILLITAPSSTIAGLWFWKHPIGQLIWQYLGVIAAIVVILKPALKLTKKIKNYEELRSGYRSLEYDLREISEKVAQNKVYDDALKKEFIKANKKKATLVLAEADSKENKKLKKRCTDEVRKELPAKSFYIPKE